MARIPDEEIERLKKEVDLAELVIRSGVALKKAGGDLVGCCPFHDDDTPSLVVTPTKGLWHCMGACQVGRVGHRLGDAHPGGELPPRRRGAARRRGSGDHPGPASPGGQAVACRARLPSPLDVSAEDQAVLSQVVDYYHATLVGLPRGPGLPGPPQDRRPGGDHPVPPGLCQPHPRLPACRPSRPRRAAPCAAA